MLTDTSTHTYWTAHTYWTDWASRCTGPCCLLCLADLLLILPASERLAGWRQYGCQACVETWPAVQMHLLYPSLSCRRSGNVAQTHERWRMIWMSSHLFLKVLCQSCCLATYEWHWGRSSVCPWSIVRGNEEKKLLTRCIQTLPRERCDSSSLWEFWTSQHQPCPKYSTTQTQRGYSTTLLLDITHTHTEGGFYYNVIRRHHTHTHYSINMLLWPLTMKQVVCMWMEMVYNEFVVAPVLYPMCWCL